MAKAGRFIGGISFGVQMNTAQLNRDVTKTRMLIRGLVGGATKLLGVFGAGVGVSAAIGKAAKSFESLNRSMSRSLAIMANVSKAMRGDMRQAAIDVARSTNFSASQAADAYFFLASAGLDAQQSLAAMPKVAKFAQAGNFDLALATDLLTDAQSALGLTVKDTTQNMENMQRVSDVLVKANTLANASVEQFSVALTTGAGAALKLVNKDVEEGVAVLAAFADQGTKAEEAGTAFGIVMRDLQTKAINFPAAFRSAGVAVFDVTGDMRNMADIIADIEKGMDGLSDSAKKSFLMDLGFADKSVKFVQTLVGTSEKIRDYERALRSAGGTTESVANSMLTPLEQAMNKLKGAFASAAEGMAPVVAMAAELVAYLADISGFNNKQSIMEHSAVKAAKAANALNGTGTPGRGFMSEVWRGIQLGGASGMSPWSARLSTAGPRGFSAPSDSPFAKYSQPHNLLGPDASKGTAYFNIGKRLAGQLVAGVQDAIPQIRTSATQIGTEMAGRLGFFGKLLAINIKRMQGPWTTKEEKAKKSGRAKAEPPSLFESGSREAYEQRVRIQNRSDSIENKQLDQLKKIADNTARNGVVLSPANLSG